MKRPYLFISLCLYKDLTPADCSHQRGFRFGAILLLFDQLTASGHARGQGIDLADDTLYLDLDELERERGREGREREMKSKRDKILPQEFYVVDICFVYLKIYFNGFNFVLQRTISNLLSVEIEEGVGLSESTDLILFFCLCLQCGQFVLLSTSTISNKLNDDG